MNINRLMKKWHELVVIANDRGIPLPMVRDPQTLEGSVSLTLVVMSSLLVAVGIVGKWSNWLGNIDMNSAFNFFYASTALYFGHNWVHKIPSSESELDPKPKKIDDPDGS